MGLIAGLIMGSGDGAGSVRPRARIGPAAGPDWSGRGPGLVRSPGWSGGAAAQVGNRLVPG
jgi:hypothetical protein